MVSTRKPSRALPAWVLAGLMLVLFALVALAARGGLHGDLLQGRLPARTTTIARYKPGHASHGPSVPVPDWTGWAALGLIGAFLLAVILRHLPRHWYRRGLRGRAEPEQDEELADFGLSPVVGDEQASAQQAALRDAVLRSLDEIRSDPDARRAIIGAYRLMQAALERTGLRRSPAEAPREYLGRALRALNVGPVAPQRLTALFERARFGEDELDLALRDEAIDALLELERAL